MAHKQVGRVIAGDLIIPRTAICLFDHHAIGDGIAAIGDNVGMVVMDDLAFDKGQVAPSARIRRKRAGVGSALFARTLEAARDLGASEVQVFRDILIPHMIPGLVAGALLAFTLSLDDFVITFFTSGPGTVTFPVKVYSMVRFSVTPEINAASTILILMTLVLTFIAIRLQKPTEIAQ